MNDADAKASKAEKIRRDASLPMSDIQSNPITALGYKKLKDPKTGIVKVGDVDDFEERGSYNPVTNKMALNSVTLRNKPKLRDDVAKHELGHVTSHALNPEPQQSTSHASKARATNKELETLRDKEENRQRRLDLTHSKDLTSRADASNWTSNMHDRDQIALDKDNEALKNKARKTLYKAYGAPDRATMSDRDLGKAATGTIIPEETYMTIKERFYANLEVIREQMGSPLVSARPVMNRPTPIRPSGPPTRPVMSRPMDNKSFVDRSSSPQDVAQKAKQKAASFGGLNWQERSALGVDMQEAEQLDELGDTWKAWRKAWKRKKKLQKLKWRALDRYYKTNDTKKRDMHMKTFKKAYLKLPIGMDEEAEQLNEENTLKDFTPPFSANGLWVSDKRGNNVLEVTRHGKVAKQVADALNKHMK